MQLPRYEFIGVADTRKVQNFDKWDLQNYEFENVHRKVGALRAYIEKCGGFQKFILKQNKHNGFMFT